MNSSNWIGRNVSRLLPAASAKQKDADAQDERAQAASKSGAEDAPKDSPAARSIPVRLEATLRQEGEALSPRLLRRALQELQAIIDPRVSEVEGGRRAMDVAAWYADAPLAQRRDLWLLMSENFCRRCAKNQGGAGEVRRSGRHARRGRGRGALPPRHRVAAPPPAAALQRLPRKAFASWSICGLKCCLS